MSYTTSEKLPPRLSDQAMCFTQNPRTAYTTYYSWKVQKADNPNSTVSPWNYQRGIASIQKWRLYLLSISEPELVEQMENRQLYPAIDGSNCELLQHER